MVNPHGNTGEELEIKKKVSPRFTNKMKTKMYGGPSLIQKVSSSTDFARFGGGSYRRSTDINPMNRTSAFYHEDQSLESLKNKLG